MNVLVDMDDVIRCVGILSSIKEGQKLKFKDGMCIDEKPSRYSRWMSGEGEKSTVDGLTDLVDKAISFNLDLDQQVINALDCLKVTYKRSTTMVLYLSELQCRIRRYTYERLLRAY